MRIVSLSLASVLFASSCDGDGGAGTIRGRMASSTSTGGSALTAGGVTREDAFTLDTVTVDLKRPEAGAAPSDWQTVETVAPNADGSFEFTDVEPGEYALFLQQPEFGGMAYAVDSTEFTLGDGETVTLVLPIVTSITYNPSLTGSTFGSGVRPTVLNDVTGELYMAGNGGIGVLDPESATLDALWSATLFRGVSHALAHIPSTNELVVVMTDRIVKIDLSIFDSGDSEVLDYDNLAVRGAIGDRVTWKRIPRDRRPSEDLGNGAFGERAGAYLSSDESILYLSTGDVLEGGPSFTLVIDVENLDILRIITAAALGYNPVSDRLYFSSPASGQLLVVDATTRLDVGVAPFAAVGVAPIPGQGEAIASYTLTNTDGAGVPFLAVVDASGNVLSDQRAAEHLGVSEDPAPGAPTFDATGEYFMLGGAAFRVVAGGGFDPIPVRIPPGPTFLERVGCNERRAVDPVSRYEIWYGCPSAPLALVALDQSNIPVGVGHNGVPFLDRNRGRAFLFYHVGVSIIHYADPSAVGRPELIELSTVGEEIGAYGAFCTDSTPCEGTEICRGDTDTAFSGHCIANPRLPFVPFCGGLTEAACDPGFECELTNPTNPRSLGYCVGSPDWDFANNGPPCNPSADDCPVGFACNGSSRCEPVPCGKDADCGVDAVCGAVALVGRVCVSAGPVPDGGLCNQASDCEHGACYVLGSRVVGVGDIVEQLRELSVCVTPCWSDDDCGPTGVCGISEIGGEVDDAPDALFFGHTALATPHCVSAPEVGADFGCSTPCRDTKGCAGGACSCWDGMCGVGVDMQAPCDDPNPGVCDGACRNGGVALPGRNCVRPCSRNSDCPWPGDCFEGGCLATAGMSAPPTPSPQPCNDGAGCADDETCVRLQLEYPDEGFVCAASDSCNDVSECSGNEECIGICSDDCNRRSDCPSGWECVDRWVYEPVRKCMTGVCGCTGPYVDDMVCRWPDEQCRIPGLCAPTACDVGEEVCNPSNSTGYSGPDCVCPACSWNAGNCSRPEWGEPTMPLSPCPADFTCLMYSDRPFGFACGCVSSSCQL